MPSKLSIVEIKAFAKQHGYETAEYGGTYKEYEVWCPVEDVKNITFSGLPFLILVKDDEIMMTDPDNALEVHRNVKWIKEES